VISTAAGIGGMETNYYQTLGGFIMTFLGRIPSSGDAFEFEHLQLEFVDMDRRRIDKIIVTSKSA
jgi:putative hemolysin